VVFHESVLVRVHQLAGSITTCTFELQLLRVGTGSSSATRFTVVHVYRPQWMSSVSNFVDELADVIATLTADSSGDCGDLNCPGQDDSSIDVELGESFESLGLTQLVDEPTRRLPDAANLLDVFAASNTTLVTNVTVKNADEISDRCLVTADTALRVPRPVIVYSSRNIRSVDAVSFEEDLRKSVLLTQPIVARHSQGPP